MLSKDALQTGKVTYLVDDEKYHRFPVTRQAFVTVSTADIGVLSYLGFLEKMHRNMAKNMMSGLSGYSQADNALDLGANALNLILGTYGFPNSQYLTWSPLFTPEFLQKNPVLFEPEELTRMVKNTAALYGADLTGIAPLDQRWVYSQDMVKPIIITEEGVPEETEEAFRIPKSVNRVIVLAFVMDHEMMETSPQVAASTAVSIGYSRMGITAVSLAEYIRALGYQAIPCMNDTALSIPLAIDAGMGQLGRHGLLITPEYGSNVRLCKVLTDLPLITDEPVDFGVTEFCENCLRCAEHCPSQSISAEKRTMESELPTGNSGVLKWYIHGEGCLRFWQENGTSCANCIAVCPFTYGFESMQCTECKRCETFMRACPLQSNTHFRRKLGYLQENTWGVRSRIIPPQRKGL